MDFPYRLLPYLIFTLLVLGGTTDSLLAQGGALDKVVTLDFTDLSIEEALELIEQSTETPLAYSRDLLPEDKLQFSVTNRPLSEVLPKILAGTNLAVS